MKLEQVVSLTDVGAVRDHNEDASLVMEDLGLLAVADGMGGLEHGEIASATAVSTLQAAREALRSLIEQVDAEATSDRRRQLGQALELVTNLGSQQIQRVLQGAHSGTTLVVGVVAGQHLVVANTGDSRAYLWRSGRLTRLTEDHSVAAARLRAGLITQEEHDESPYQHMLYQALGTQGEVDPDLIDEPLAAGDIVMLCSDGLTGPVTEQRCEAILTETPNIADAAQRLLDEANANGGPDNITLILHRVEVGPDPAALSADNTRLRNFPLARALKPLDLRMLRNYLDYSTFDDGASIDGKETLHFILTGTATRAGEQRTEGDALNLARFLGRPPHEAWTAQGPVTTLSITRESYEALEGRRPRVAARVVRGLLNGLV